MCLADFTDEDLATGGRGQSADPTENGACKKLRPSTMMTKFEQTGNELSQVITGDGLGVGFNGEMRHLFTR